MIFWDFYGIVEFMVGLDVCFVVGVYDVIRILIVLINFIFIVLIMLNGKMLMVDYRED